MTNATSRKYYNIYMANKDNNPFFDKWIDDNFDVTVSYEPWNWGCPTFTEKKTGKRIYSEAIITQMYCRGKRPYYRTFADVDLTNGNTNMVNLMVK